MSLFRIQEILYIQNRHNPFKCVSLTKNATFRRTLGYCDPKLCLRRINNCGGIVKNNRKNKWWKQTLKNNRATKDRSAFSTRVHSVCRSANWIENLRFASVGLLTEFFRIPHGGKTLNISIYFFMPVDGCYEIKIHTLYITYVIIYTIVLWTDTHALAKIYIRFIESVRLKPLKETFPTNIINSKV